MATSDLEIEVDAWRSYLSVDSVRSLCPRIINAKEWVCITDLKMYIIRPQDPPLMVGMFPHAYSYHDPIIVPIQAKDGKEEYYVLVMTLRNCLYIYWVDVAAALAKEKVRPWSTFSTPDEFVPIQSYCLTRCEDVEKPIHAHVSAMDVIERSFGEGATDDFVMTGGLLDQTLYILVYRHVKFLLFHIPYNETKIGLSEDEQNSLPSKMTVFRLPERMKADHFEVTRMHLLAKKEIWMEWRPRGVTMCSHDNTYFSRVALEKVLELCRFALPVPMPMESLWSVPGRVYDHKSFIISLPAGAVPDSTQYLIVRQQISYDDRRPACSVHLVEDGPNGSLWLHSLCLSNTLPTRNGSAGDATIFLLPSPCPDEYPCLFFRLVQSNYRCLWGQPVYLDVRHKRVCRMRWR